MDSTVKDLIYWWEGHQFEPQHQQTDAGQTHSWSIVFCCKCKCLVKTMGLHLKTITSVPVQVVEMSKNTSICMLVLMHQLQCSALILKHTVMNFFHQGNPDFCTSPPNHTQFPKCTSCTTWDHHCTLKILKQSTNRNHKKKKSFTKQSYRQQLKSGNI